MTPEPRADAPATPVLPLPALLLALALPPAVALLLAWAGILDWAWLRRAWSLRLWGTATALALVASTVRSVVARRPAPALGAAALLLLFGCGAAWSLLGVDAEADAGEGEEGVPWREAFVGPLGRTPELVALEIPGGGTGLLRLRVDGRELRVPEGGMLRVPGVGEVEVRGVYDAPVFTVRRGGAIEGEGLLKLAPGKREYFQAGELPHRFYVSSLPGGPGEAPPATARLRLRVQRGKVKVLERDLAFGEAVAFEGLTLRFDLGARWARVAVRSRAARWPLAAAAALAVAALGAAWWERRRRPGGGA